MREELDESTQTDKHIDKTGDSRHLAAEEHANVPLKKTDEQPVESTYHEEDPRKHM
jgi:hypothetical protein